MAADVGKGISAVEKAPAHNLPWHRENHLPSDLHFIRAAVAFTYFCAFYCNTHCAVRGSSTVRAWRRREDIFTNHYLITYLTDKAVCRAVPGFARIC